MKKPILVAVIGLAVLAVSQTAFAFRTAEDLPEFAGTGKVAWQNLDVPVFLSDSTPGPLATGGVDAVLMNALAKWSGLDCGQPKLTVAGHTYGPAVSGDGANTVQWVTFNWASYGFASDAAAMTDVQYQSLANGGWEIVEADIYLNAESYSWSFAPNASGDSQDLSNVLLHETGHIVGLLHPCELDEKTGVPACSTNHTFENSVMYPIYRSGLVVPGSDDISGVCYLYGSEGCPAEGCADGTLCSSGVCVPSCGGVLCSSGETCVNEECVNPSIDEGTDSDAGTDGVSVIPGGNGELWDPCATDDGCKIGTICTRDGYCSVPCREDDDCGSNNSCANDGLCRPGGGVFGEQCGKADDCSSNICIESLGGPSTCSRECDLTAEDCPGGQSCQRLDDEGPVCAPLVDSAGCGCRFIGKPLPSNLRNSLGILLLGACVALWRSRSNLA